MLLLFLLLLLLLLLLLFLFFVVFVKLINLLLSEISVQSELVSRQFWMAAAMQSGRKLIAQTKTKEDSSVK